MNQIRRWSVWTGRNSTCTHWRTWRTWRMYACRTCMNLYACECSECSDFVGTSEMVRTCLQRPPRHRCTTPWAELIALDQGKEPGTPSLFYRHEVVNWQSPIPSKPYLPFSHPKTLEYLEKVPSRNLTYGNRPLIYNDFQWFTMIYLFRMVIFHGYVRWPESAPVASRWVLGLLLRCWAMTAGPVPVPFLRWASDPLAMSAKMNTPNT